MADGGALTIVSKSEFARRIGRSPAAVSGYIKSGKLTGRALVRDGGGERIVVAEALRQLDLSLDPTQRVTQAVARPGPRGEPERGKGRSADGGGPDEDDEESSVLEDQRRLLRANRKIKETKDLRDRTELLAANATWVRVSEIQSAWGRQMARLVALIEAEFPKMARDLAAASPGDEKAARKVLRESWRAVRARLGDQAADIRSGLSKDQDAGELGP